MKNTRTVLTITDFLEKKVKNIEITEITLRLAQCAEKQEQPKYSGSYKKKVYN